MVYSTTAGGLYPGGSLQVRVRYSQIIFTTNKVIQQQKKWPSTYQGFKDKLQTIQKRSVCLKVQFLKSVLSKPSSKTNQ